MLFEGNTPVVGHEGDVAIHVLLERTRLAGDGLQDVVELRDERAEEARGVDEEEDAVDLQGAGYWLLSVWGLGRC